MAIAPVAVLRRQTGALYGDQVHEDLDFRPVSGYWVTFFRGNADCVPCRS